MSNVIFSFFRENSSPKTGLSPTIDIWEKDGTHTVDGAAMTEIAGGFYYYDFASYDTSKDYVIRTDGGAVLSDSERYQSAISYSYGDIMEEINDIKGTGFVKDSDSLVNIRAETDKVESIKAKTDSLPSDPADQSLVESAISASETNIRGVDNDTLKIISDQLDGVQTDLDNPSQYQADVSSLALEANIEGHVTDALNTYDPPTRAEATSDKNEIIAEVDANEVKIDGLPTTSDIDDQLTASHGSGSWVGDSGLTQQQVRDAMKLAPGAGAPGSGSIDEHLDDILSDTSAIDSRLPSDPADESQVENAISVSESNIRGGSDTLANLSDQLDTVQADLDNPSQYQADISTLPTDIMNEIIEGTLTLRQVQRLLLAVLAGKSDGAGGATQHFRDTQDTKNRITATLDEDGNRTAIVLDES